MHQPPGSWHKFPPLIEEVSLCYTHFPQECSSFKKVPRQENRGIFSSTGEGVIYMEETLSWKNFRVRHITQPLSVQIVSFSLLNSVTHLWHSTMMKINNSKNLNSKFNHEKIQILLREVAWLCLTWKWVFLPYKQGGLYPLRWVTFSQAVICL